MKILHFYDLREVLDLDPFLVTIIVYQYPLKLCFQTHAIDKYEIEKDRLNSKLHL